MPKKATSNPTTLVNVRFTPEIVSRIDQLVENGAAVSRTDFVKDAVMLKLYLEENLVAKFVVTSKEPLH